MVKEPKENMTTHSIGRALRMGNLGFRVAGSYLGYQVQNVFLDSETRAKKKKTLHQKNAKRIREELQSLRGPVMKLGQALSMQGQSIPDEVIAELTELQMHAPPMHPTLMRTQFRNALGKYPEEVFAGFDIEPFAAASLGQVHRAVTLDGDEVAVKIQYPAIRQAIQNDFALLRTVSFPARMTRHLSDDMLKEAEEGILLETDYRNEARNIEYFHEKLQALPFISVPKVLPEYSAEKVLTMTYMKGETLDCKLRKKCSERWKNLAGAHLFEFMNYQLYCMNAVHADPHPGNYLYQDDGTIGLVDFGCVKYFSDRIAESCRGIRMRTWSGDENEYARLMKLVWGGNTDPKNLKHRRLMDDLIEFYELIYPKDKSEVDFGKKTTLDRLFEVWNHALKNKLTMPEYFFLCRTELGIYNILYKLGAKIRTVDVAEKWLRHGL